MPFDSDSSDNDPVSPLSPPPPPSPGPPSPGGPNAPRGYQGPPLQAPAPPPAPPRHSGGGGGGGGGKSILSKIVGGLVTTLLLFSLLLNFYLGVIVMSFTAGPSEQVYREGDQNHRVVILPITGLIDESTTGFVRSALAKLEEDLPSAIVLRVDSGGGYVQPSDLIWHYLKAFKDKHEIPIIASFGQIAASGGYYVAAPSDMIFVEPTTITGSIGVLSTAFTIDGMLGKIGVTPEVAAATQSPEKDVANNIFRPWDARDRTAQQTLIDGMYERFLEVVVEGRAHVLSEEEIRLIADGSIYDSDAAIANKLVDKEGYLDAAIDEAISRINVPSNKEAKVTIIRAAYSPGLLGLLGYHGGTGAGAGALSAYAPGGISLSDLATPIRGEEVRRLMLEMATPRPAYLYSGR